MNRLLGIFLSLILIGICNVLQAQFLTSITINPTVPLDCNATTVTVVGDLPCGNAIMNGTSHTIIGNLITVVVDVTQPIICLPIIVQFNQTETLGNVPAGNYTVHVDYIINGIVVDTMSTNMVVGSCCSVNSSFLTTATDLCPGDNLNFVAADTSLASYSWLVDNVPFDSTSQTSYTFSTPGIYTVTLEGGDGSCFTNTSQVISVSSPQLTFNQVLMENCPGMMDGSIDLQVSGGVAPYSYMWSNGETTQDISQLAGGAYTVSVTDSIGCMSTDTAVVTTGIPVTASLSTGSPSQLCLWDSAILSGTSMGATTYNWLANNIPFSQLPSPTYTFNITGPVDITLIASNSTCSDTASIPFTVFSPVATNLMITDETCTGSADGAIDLDVIGGIPAYSYLWSTGDTTQDISQINGGSYSLTIMDSLGCTTVDSFMVPIGLGVTADFTASADPSLCPGETVMFDNTSLLASTFDWLSNGQSFSQAMDASFTFPDSGQIEIVLVAMEGICTDTSAAFLFSVNAAPQRNATVTGISCPDSRDGAIDLTLTGGAAPFDFLWSTGETSEDISALPDGSYDVMITDSANCSLIDTFEVGILGGALADFAAYPVGQGMQFSDQSDSTVVSWLWDFGTGADSSTEQNPFFEYPISGEYIVCLTTEDSYGCTDTKCDTLGFVIGVDPSLYQPLSVFPNPTSEFLSIDLAALLGQEVQVELFDARGKRVLARSMIAERRGQLDLSSFSEGIYLLRVQAGDRWFKARVVKE